jgi:hypothetical protein
MGHNRAPVLPVLRVLYLKHLQKLSGVEKVKRTSRMRASFIFLIPQAGSNERERRINRQLRVPVLKRGVHSTGVLPDRVVS